MPIPSLECIHILRTHEEQKIKRSVGLRQASLKGLRNLFSTVFMASMGTLKIMICTGGPTRLKDILTDGFGTSEDLPKGGSEAIRIRILKIFFSHLFKRPKDITGDGTGSNKLIQKLKDILKGFRLLEVTVRHPHLMTRFQRDSKNIPQPSRDIAY
ncbi:hypothetical protein X943_000698 [Babesia divergens]|uniref:Uncharacterized protein n=1 Tax=Babesia divergens TaxID=32595 RepID=A0AAD9GBY5_BABDI|nr:hypothetical protein X943_000698 [Babesia divergens]